MMATINIRGVPYAASQLKHRLSREMLLGNVPKKRRDEMNLARDAFDLINRRCAADDETAKMFRENASRLIEWGIITEPELQTLVDSSAGRCW